MAPIVSYGQIKSIHTVPINKGVLDLRNYNLQQNGYVYLSGDWEFYWNTLLTPESFKTDTFSNVSYFKWPGLWNGHIINGQKLNGQGYATHRLRVLLPPGQESLKIKLNRVETAYKLWANGVIISEVGKVGTSRSTMEPDWLPVSKEIQITSDTLELVMQISNFKHRKGGIAHNLLLGTPEALDNETSRLIIFDMFIISVMLIMGLYYFSIFWLRKVERAHLYFSLVLIFSAIFTLFTGEILMKFFFPHGDWNLFLKLNFIANVLRVGAFALFMYELSPANINKKVVYVFSGIAIAHALFVIVTPPYIYTHSLFLFMFNVALTVIYCVYGMIKATLKKEEGAFFSILGLFILFGTIANDMLHELAIIHTLMLIPIGLFSFIFFQSFMLSIRTTRSFFAVEQLSSRLLILDKIKDEFLSVNSYNLSIPLQILARHLNAGLCHLLIKENDTWYIKASSYSEAADIPISGNLDIYDKLLRVPYSVIQETIEYKEPIVYNSKNIKQRKATDPYFKNFESNSLASIPIIENHHIKGVLYLEGNQHDDKFDEEKLKVLNLLLSQISTLVDNAKIYYELQDLNRTLEEKVQLRTNEVYQQKEEISAQRDEIEKKNDIMRKAYDEISQKNREITDSINYARRIQDSILPHNDYIKILFPQSFIFFRPKSVLSGDFYWIDQVYVSALGTNFKHEKLIFAAIDCTGHGVPGALMSIIGNNLLNYAVNELNETNPAKILNIMEQGVRAKLKQTDQKAMSKDGMDAAIICFDKHTQELEFSGARNPLYLIRNNTEEVEIIPANKFSIGGFDLLKSPKDFTSTRTKINQGDMIYLFTDGFADQVGGPHERKFMGPSFRKLLGAIHSFPVHEQRMLLDEAITNWQGVNKQIDDILVAGIRF